jgi:uncharacterized protein YkwD
MRLVPWLGTFLLVGLIGVSVGASAFNHTHMARPGALVAAQPAPPAVYDTGDTRGLPPKSLRPLPSPSPSPAPIAAPAALRPVPPQLPPPQRAIVVGSTQQALINSDRAGRGLGPLTWNGCLYNVAVANARRIAAQGYLSHTNGPNVDLTCGLGHQAGENIGWYSGGANDSWMNSTFMGSPEHYANIMGPYHYVATAWVTTADGRGWIAVEFG